MVTITFYYNAKPLNTRLVLDLDEGTYRYEESAYPTYQDLGSVEVKRKAEITRMIENLKCNNFTEEIEQ